MPPALVHGDDARLHVTEALKDRERLRGDVLAAGGELAVRPGHHLAVLVAIGVLREGCVHGGEGLRGIEPLRVVQRRFDRFVAAGELLGPGRVVHHGTRSAQAIDIEDEPFGAAACGHQRDFGELVGDHAEPHAQHTTSSSPTIGLFFTSFPPGARVRVPVAGSVYARSALARTNRSRVAFRSQLPSTAGSGTSVAMPLGKVFAKP